MNLNKDIIELEKKVELLMEWKININEMKR